MGNRIFVTRLSGHNCSSSFHQRSRPRSLSRGVTAHGGPSRAFAVWPAWKPSLGRQRSASLPLLRKLFATPSCWSSDMSRHDPLQ